MYSLIVLINIFLLWQFLTHAISMMRITVYCTMLVAHNIRNNLKNKCFVQISLVKYHFKEYLGNISVKKEKTFTLKKSRTIAMYLCVYNCTVWYFDGPLSCHERLNRDMHKSYKLPKPLHIQHIFQLNWQNFTT